MMSRSLVASALYWLFAAASAQAESCAQLLEALDNAKAGERVGLVIKIGNLGQAGRDAVPVLENLLHSPNDDLANQSARSLAQVGEPALDTLIQGTRNDDLLVSLRCLWALSLMGPDAKQSLPDLLKLLDHPHERVRGAALFALGEMGAAAIEATPQIVKSIRAPSAMVRYNAVLAIAKIGVVSIDDLRRLLQETDPEVRADAARALRVFGHHGKAALPDLDGALKDPSEEVRAAAALTVGAMGKVANDRLPQVVVLLQDLDYDVQVAALQSALALGAGDPRLMAALREANRTGKWATPFILKQFGKNPGDAVPQLIKTLQNKDPSNRMAAAYALGQIGLPARSAVPALQKMLQKAYQDRQSEMHMTVLTALRQINNDVVEENNPGLREFKRAIEAQAESLRNAQIAGLFGGDPDKRINAFQIALRNKRAVSYYDSVLQMYVAISLNKVANKQLEKMVDSAGLEAIPALVNTVNRTANMSLGFS
jgi:HEAT repeat protein